MVRVYPAPHPRKRPPLRRPPDLRNRPAELLLTSPPEGAVLPRKKATSPGQIPEFDHLERHFAPREMAELWGVSESTIRRIFQDEVGVLRIGKDGRKDGKLDYVTLRVPGAVAERVHRRMTS